MRLWISRVHNTIHKKITPVANKGEVGVKLKSNQKKSLPTLNQAPLRKAQVLYRKAEAWEVRKGDYCRQLW